jgi:3-oxoacyl-[acyl-carrier protein] reductase
MQIVVTGSSGGMGAEIVARFLMHGAQVVGIDRSPAGNANDEHQAFRFLQCDLADSSSRHRVNAALLGSLASLDLLVHCAGVFYDDQAARTSEAIQQELWRTNYLGPVAMTEALQLPLSQGDSPSVIFIASADAVVASGGQNSEVGTAHDLYYAASKGALLTAMRALAMRWAAHNIRVNAICPTIVRSPMTAELLTLPDKEEQLCRAIPLGRLGMSADIATAVECLHRLTFTTAHALPVDGGYLCR